MGKELKYSLRRVEDPSLLYINRIAFVCLSVCLYVRPLIYRERSEIFRYRNLQKCGKFRRAGNRLKNFHFRPPEMVETMSYFDLGRLKTGKNAQKQAKNIIK